MRPRAFVPGIVALVMFVPACTDGSKPVDDAALRSEAPPEAPLSMAPVEAPPERSTREERMLDAVLAGQGAYVAVPEPRYLEVWKRLGRDEPNFLLDTSNPSARRAPMLVASAERRGTTTWLEVYLPIRPNGIRAWVDADDVRVRERHERIEVDLSDRTLRRYRDGELVERLTVGVGQPRFPTAVGTFYVWVKVRYEDPNGAYGPLALGLSGFSPVLSDWPGEGRMAIHGTSNPGDRGLAVSHGCVRVYNPQLLDLADVPLGTPVVITR